MCRQRPSREIGWKEDNGLVSGFYSVRGWYEDSMIPTVRPGLDPCRRSMISPRREARGSINV